MKVKYLMCGICEHWHMPKAHNGHCPACGATKLVIHHKPIYINWLTERVMIKSGWPIILKRLINTAASE